MYRIILIILFSPDVRHKLGLVCAKVNLTLIKHSNALHTVRKLRFQHENTVSRLKCIGKIHAFLPGNGVFVLETEFYIPDLYG